MRFAILITSPGIWRVQGDWRNAASTRDLYEIPQTIENLNPVIARPVRLEAAVPVRDGGGSFTTLPKFSYTHQITGRVFARIRDDTDYTVSNTVWAARLTGEGRCRSGVEPVEAGRGAG
jgi:hypothetical protein